MLYPLLSSRRGFQDAKCVCFCTIGGAVVYIVWTIASARSTIENSPRATIPVLVFIYVYSPFCNIGWKALAYTYLVELFPFQQRLHGIAVEQLSVRAAVFFNTHLNPIALDSIGWKYYIVYYVWIMVEILTVYFFFPETHNQTLEQLNFMFEGKEMQDNVKKNMDKVLSMELEKMAASPARDFCRLQGRRGRLPGYEA
ncbi:hypothetical protein B0T20DRAFT_182532 [Sordaria brevicollis]|uniref:Major facilitator superfamily (MFS) profile domain-containing protein n=1 Tax=Sordaria brevicollis TaxID=83679 RepID=A0AAE0PI39_SORBR|nr:hypothetical protein B0T20DRAFT_182532 [Sordaria brevicollis]